jgi:hypothetical protein
MDIATNIGIRIGSGSESEPIRIARTTQSPNLKRDNLALQGGGAHGAFTWGVVSVWPHNRVRDDYDGENSDRLRGQSGRDRSLAPRRWCYGVGFVAQVRRATSYNSIEVGRSLTELALAACGTPITDPTPLR